MSETSEVSDSASSSAAMTMVAPRSGLPPFPPFDPFSDPATVGERWKKWVRRFENLLISLREYESTVQRGLLLTYVGESVNDIFDILPDTGSTYESAVKSLTDHFQPKVNKSVAIYDFRELVQGMDEPLNEFYRKLKTKAANCGFGANEDEEIKTQIIHKTRDIRLRKKALREEMNLNDVLTYGLTLERTDMQVEKIQKGIEGINFMKRKYQENRKSTRQQLQIPPAMKSQHKNPNNTCRNCGGAFPHKNGMETCPAKNLNCHNCGKRGHLKKFCRSKANVHVVSETTPPETTHYSHTTYSDESSDDNIFTLKSPFKTQPETEIQIGGRKIKILIDSGASVNILNKGIFDKIRSQMKVNLKPTKAKIHAYGADKPLQLAGEFKTTITSQQGKTTAGTFYVVNGKTKCILGFQSSTELGLLTLNINSITNHEDPHIQNILNKHEKLFKGTGNLKGVEVKLEIDETATPVAQPARRVPHSMLKKVNLKLEEMREDGIIEKVEGATPWLSPLIPIPKKNGEVRLVLDMRIPNAALVRRRVQIPTVDEILRQMQGAKFFTEVDLSQGYLQLTLAKESRYITAFPTPNDGPHQFKRLIMGASPSGEYFHEIINNLIRDIPGCANISDNIWLWSTDKESHYKQLENLLATLETNGLTLKLPKCTFMASEINVFGHIVSANGIRPDDDKIEAVKNASPPKSASEVRSFLGLTNYCSRYIAQYSTITAPLRQLTKANAKFHWGDEQDKSFRTLKQVLTCQPVLAHYCLEAKTRVVVDASPWAVGAILLQEQADHTYQPVAYGSRSLTETEQKYGQIEKESLAIVFGCEHFHMYLYGRNFELETDHRPLQHIYETKANGNKPAPARIERWRLRLQEYDFKVVYRPGKGNLADSLSRLPKETHSTAKSPRSSMEACADRYVRYLAEHQTPRAMTVEEIIQASMKDKELTQVREHLKQHQTFKLPQPYKSLANELSVTDQDILLRDHRIVLPVSLRDRAIKLAHEDHAGMTRCKQRIRSKLWWPHMDKQIEEHIKCCHPCQITAKPPCPEPMTPTELPKAPWTQLAIDICGPFPSGEYIAVLTDYYSRWPEAKILKSVTSATILKWLSHVFAQHGYPEELKSDNASYFTSTEFKDTLRSWGIQPKTVTEYWPQANGQVERFNEVINKHIRTAQAEDRDWRKTFPNMLLHYRATPHRMTGQTPAKLLFQRELRTKIPSIQLCDLASDSELRKQDTIAKAKAKNYTDKTRYASHRTLQIGDQVLVTQKRQNKYSTRFNKNPMTILKILGSQLILQDIHGQQHRRNLSHVKEYKSVVASNRKDDDEEDDEQVQSNHSPDQDSNQQPSVDEPATVEDATIPPVQKEPSDQRPPDNIRRSTRIRLPPKHLKDYQRS